MSTRTPPPCFWPGQTVRPANHDPRQHDDIRGTVIEAVYARTINGEKQNILVRWTSPCGRPDDDPEWFHPTELRPWAREPSPPTE